MRVLLDMHTFLWFVLGDPRLTPNAKASIEEPGNEKVVSPASYWEITIKSASANIRCRSRMRSSWQEGLSKRFRHLTHRTEAYGGVDDTAILPP